MTRLPKKLAKCPTMLWGSTLDGTGGLVLQQEVVPHTQKVTRAPGPPASDEGGAAGAVVTVGVAARQVGRGHQRVAVVGATVLGQRVDNLLAARLAGVRHRAVTVGVPRHQVHAVLRGGDIYFIKIS